MRREEEGEGEEGKKTGNGKRIEEKGGKDGGKEGGKEGGKSG